MASRPMVPTLLAASLAVILAFAVVLGCASKSSAPGGGTNTAPKELDSGNLTAGNTYSHRFLNSGDFAYHCNYHSVMTGTVHVNPAAADSIADVNITSNAVPFPAASVLPGGVVTWHNNSAMTHTVTSN